MMTFPVKNSLMHSLLAVFLMVVLSVVGSKNSQAASQELRIETDVFAGDSDESLSHTVTLFDSGTVYDFVESKQQVTVFRPATKQRAGQFVLLDLKTERRTEVSTEKIEALMKKLSKWALKQDDALLKFSAKPDFKENFVPGTGQLTLESTPWNYTVATVPAKNDDALNNYREFIDWYTRLNVMMYSSPPPGPRLALNAALAKHGVVPVEIRRTLNSESKTLRATHLFSWRLSREDRAEVEKARQHLANFKKVDNKKFLASRAEAADVVRGQSK